MRNVLSFDLGATSGRGIITSFNGASFDMKEIHRFDDYYVKKGKKMYWDLESILDNIKYTIKLSLESCVIDSIGVDTWGVDFGLIDKSGELICPPYHYRDQRTSGMLEKVDDQFSLSEIYNRTGIQLMEINSLYQILAYKYYE